ncbi:MAG: protoporphyrinogen oxidase [Streptosporangiaceae bacterium]|nr:protoporphyrinogen oxidase [Streptosporangiaceae bacterium]MBV9856101.1 protoporphyrinogen oxidase [Streptosporangiaceae bacterium]
MASHVVIVGGGIAGLAAAFFLRDEPVRVTVLEGSPRLGGKLAVSEVAGIAVDEGAEALLARRPEGTGLITAAGLGYELAAVGATSSAIWTRGALRPLPGRQFMGVPSDMDELGRSGVLSGDGLARAREERRPPDTEGDVSVEEYVGGHLGQEVVDRLVDPLLGGVYAGRSSELSFEATLSPLAVAARRHVSLAEAAASLLPPARPAGQPGAGAGGTAPAPLFTTLTGGLGMLPGVLAKVSGATVRTGAMVRGLARTERGWRLTVGSAAEAEIIDADAVILAIPGRPAGRLLAGVPGAARAAAELGAIPYASTAIITLGYRRSAFPGPAGVAGGVGATGDALRDSAPEAGGPLAAYRAGLRDSAPEARRPLAAQGRSGYLVPAIDGRAVKAVTFSTVKWPHLARAADRAAGTAAAAGTAPATGATAAGTEATRTKATGAAAQAPTRPAAPGGGGEALEIVRCSIGRIGEEALLQRDDADLVALAAAELAEATGVRGAPAASRVTRWGGALPQYTVGHLDRVAGIRAAVAAQPGLAVCGAAYDGVGIPACVATARAAVDQVLGHLRAVAKRE